MHPVLFEIGGVTVRSYGFFVALGFFVAFFLLYREARRKNFFPDKILDIELVILIAGIIGARALHVFVNLGLYSVNPIEAFFVWRGGLAFYGGMIFALIACWLFIRMNKMPLWKTADMIAPYMALGHSIGRIGCFFNGCCFGKYALSSPFGVIFPGDFAPRYPTQLFESFGLVIIFIILKSCEKKAPFDGFLILVYIILYSVFRFMVEFFRGDIPTYFPGFTISQYLSIGLIIVALGFLYGRIKVHR